MRSYEMARGLFSFLAFLSWMAICGGAILSVTGAGLVETTSRWGGGPTGFASLLGSVPGLIVGGFGMLGLAASQIGRASVDTAEYTQQMLSLARDQLQVSRQALKQSNRSATFSGHQNGAKDEPSAASTKGATGHRQAPQVLLDHLIGSTVKFRSHSIDVTEDGYVLNGKIFPTLAAAKASLESAPGEPAPALPPAPAVDQNATTPSVSAGSLKRS